MNILVIDADTGLQEYYTNLMESEFQNVVIDFQPTAKLALDFIPSHEVDIVITETSVGDMDIFELIENLVAHEIPVIVVSSESTERLIVETLRAGALDFISKNNIKLGLIPVIISRALLEADRWAKINNHTKNIPHREAWTKLDKAARTFIHSERQEKQRNSMYNADASQAQEHVYIEGESYYIIYLYLQLLVPKSLREGMDERVYLNLQSRLLDKFSEIVPKHGGSVWTRKEDAAFFAFNENSYLSALLCAMEIRADLQLSAFTTEHYEDPMQLRIGMAASKTTYRKDKGQIYSEGLNLAAHLALYYPEPDAIVVTSGFYEHLNPRPRKYFFKVPELFEGHTIFKFEYLS